MKLKNLKLINFKNYVQQEFQFAADIVAITGDNGMGKTNLLDAIYYLAMGRSYFTASDRQIIHTEGDFTRIECEAWQGNASHSLVLKMKPSSIKELQYNAATFTKYADFIGTMPIVVVAPDDVHALMSGNEERRVFLNNTLVQFDVQYLKSLSHYNRLLKQRNALLKDFNERQYIDLDLLHVLTQAMEPHALYIFDKRKEVVIWINNHFVQIYNRISGGKEACSLDYLSHLQNGEWETLHKESWDKDRYLCRTNVGIHKDELAFIMNGYPLKDFASQGQLKSFIFALKLSQYYILTEKTGKTPTVLLDDIFDKLDATRVKQIINILSEDGHGQVFITDTHSHRIKALIDGPISFQEIQLK
jgi:DNA replication and repair protein RecF